MAKGCLGVSLINLSFLLFLAQSQAQDGTARSQLRHDAEIQKLSERQGPDSGWEALGGWDGFYLVEGKNRSGFEPPEIRVNSDRLPESAKTAEQVAFLKEFYQVHVRGLSLRRAEIAFDASMNRLTIPFAVTVFYRDVGKTTWSNLMARANVSGLNSMIDFTGTVALVFDNDLNVVDVQVTAFDDAEWYHEAPRFAVLGSPGDQGLETLREITEAALTQDLSRPEMLQQLKTIALERENGHSPGADL